MAGSGHVKKMAREGSFAPLRSFTLHVCTHATSTGSRSGRFATATRPRWRRCSHASARARVSSASAAPSRGSPRTSSRPWRASTATTTCSSPSSTATPRRQVWPGSCGADVPPRSRSRSPTRTRAAGSGRSSRRARRGRACRRHHRAGRDGVRRQPGHRLALRRVADSLHVSGEVASASSCSVSRAEAGPRRRGRPPPEANMPPRGQERAAGSRTTFGRS